MDVRLGGRRLVRLGSLVAAVALVGVLVGCDTTPVVVSGTVTSSPSGAGVGGVVVQVYADEAEQLVAETTSSVVGGRWELRASTLPDGTYRIRVGERWWPAAGSWDDADGVAVSAGSGTTLDISLDEVGEVVGTVVDDSGLPLSAPAVVALVRASDGQGVGAAQTDTVGAFSLPVVDAGTYRVLIFDSSRVWPVVFVGGATPTDREVTSGSVGVGTIDVSTGRPFMPPGPVGTTTRVSVATDGSEPDEQSHEPELSADGRFVVFQSYASNLVAGDTNGAFDVFVHDRATGATSRVSVASDASEAVSGSGDPSISGDGRFVAFVSSASNLVAGDTNGHEDVFVHDRATGATSRVSVASNGTQAADSSFQPAISANGRFVSFTSDASNLVAGDTNDYGDVFVHDRATGATSRVSIASDGTQSIAGGQLSTISADARFVAFYTWAPNLVAGDTNGDWDVFVHDRSTGETTRVSVASDGSQANRGSLRPSISEDGRFVAFESNASNLVAGDMNLQADVFVHDRATGETTRVSTRSGGTGTPFGESTEAAISADGRFVAFKSWADLVQGDTNGNYDIFVHDRATDATTRVSVASTGIQANGGSQQPAISADGRVVTFASWASSLVPHDSNGQTDIFVHERPAA